jgi:choline dehydrogenase-like flavoprotein
MCLELLEFFDAEKVSLDPKDGFLEFGDGGTPHHAGGTLRMGAKGSSVVDTNLKFHHRDNLYACDVSVFPMIPAANPSLTLSALALRLADHLTAKLQNGNAPFAPVVPGGDS